MPKPKYWLNIELESGSTYAPGEFITGAVVVRVLEQCRCEELSLSWGWRTQGHGEPDASPPEWLLTLSEQEEWLPGQQLRYPFRLEAPRSPFTHHGHMLSVDWFLRAEVRLSGLLDTRSHTEEPFFLVPAETRRPASPAIGPGTWRKLEVEVPKHDTGVASILFALLSLLLAVRLLANHPALSWLLVFLFLGYVIHRCIPGNPVRSHPLGTLWLSSETVAPGELVELRLQLQPEQSVHEHHLSISLECVEAATNRDQDGAASTHETSLYTETLLEWTSPALSEGELLQSPPVKGLVPHDGPPSFKFKNNELRWFLRIEARFEGDTRVFLQLVPLQVQPHCPMSQTAGVRREALSASREHGSASAPWLQARPIREKKRPGPQPSVEARRKLEGGIEVLEAAHTHYTVLEKALQERKWKLHLRPWLETLQETRHQEPALVEALDRLHQRARAEGWSETEPALALAREVEGLRARVGGLVSRRLGTADHREAHLARELEQLERSVVQTLPLPLAAGEKVLCTGGFSPSPALVGLLLLGVFFQGRLWVAWMVLIAVCVWSQYRRSGRFWLTEERLIWLPTRGDPLQVSQRDLHPGGTSRHLKGVKVRTQDGRTVHLEFISHARALVDRLMR